jgi:hypothetical protein
MRGAAGTSALLICLAVTGCQSWDGPFGLLRPRSDVVYVKSQYAVGGFGNAFGNSIAPEQMPGLYLESVLLERPVGDPILDRELWGMESAGISPKTRTLLAENGIRVAVLGGNLPAAFQRLLESKDSAVDPHGMTFANRSEAVLPTVGPIDKCEYQVLADLSGRRETLKLAKASGGMLVKPERTEDGRVKLTCEPQVQHGERHDWIRPTADATGFTFQGELPLERYPGLAFHVTLGPGDYLVIGSPSEAADTLGAALFNVEAKIESRQRVLVIRAGFRGEARSDLPPVPRPRGFRPIAFEANRWSQE